MHQACLKPCSQGVHPRLSWICSPYFNNVSGVRAYAYTPENLFSVGSALLLEDRKSTLVVGISQTGTSSGVLSALSKAIKEGFGSLAITATVPSPIEKMSDNVLNLMCGEEDSNAKTKGYSATLTVLLLLSLFPPFLSLSLFLSLLFTFYHIFISISKAISWLLF